MGFEENYLDPKKKQNNTSQVNKFYAKNGSETGHSEQDISRTNYKRENPFGTRTTKEKTGLGDLGD